jgi:hypothetical protein
MTTTEPTNLEIAEQFVADKHWLWLRGLVMRYPNARPDDMRATVVKCLADCIEGETPIAYENDITRFGWNPCEGWLPDIDNPATLGCIEHGMVPAALQDPDACLCFNPHERNWFVYSPKHDDCTTSKSTKPAALLAALQEADDFVRRSVEGPHVQAEDFDDPDDFDDRDGDGYDERDDGEDRDWLPRSGFTLPDAPAEPQPRCTRPPDPRAVAARDFLEGQRQRDADREAQRLAKQRAREVPPIVRGAYERAQQHADDPFVGSAADFARLVAQGFDVPGFREDGLDVRRACRAWSQETPT